jgi:hypothetical protein
MTSNLLHMPSSLLFDCYDVAARQGNEVRELLFNSISCQIGRHHNAEAWPCDGRPGFVLGLLEELLKPLLVRDLEDSSRAPLAPIFRLQV